VSRIIVSGYMIRLPVPGNMLAYLQYVSGFERLGHEVHYIEESGWERACYRVSTGEFGDDPSEGISIVRSLFEGCGVNASAWFVDRATGAVHGASQGEHELAVEQADLLVNLGGTCWLDEFAQIGVRAYVDMDPAFTQAGRFGLGTIPQHTVHYTYGANIGRNDCSIPDDGINWIPTHPPVVVDLFDAGGVETTELLTTIANWTAYGSVVAGERRLGQKDEEFLRLGSLPSKSSVPLEIAVSGIDESSKAKLEHRGWRLRDASDLDVFADYRAYIQGSKGEFSAAKHGYVTTRSGWFSDRSVCYLAAGRPVILQDTGFSDWLPTGVGVLPFRNADEALGAIDKVRRDYPRHQAAAQALSREVFSHNTVLSNLLDRLQ
jgi:hypothetical protein